MKHVFLNLKRFDIPPERGGVNRLCPPREWGGRIVTGLADGLKAFRVKNARFAAFFPEAHLIPALRAMPADSPLAVGCQSVHEADSARGGNFGAFTTVRPANAMKALGCTDVIIGHCEERAAMKSLLTMGGCRDFSAVDRMLGKRVKAALAAGLRVLYCIGETEGERENAKEVLKGQTALALSDVNPRDVVLAYEPVWAIGPGKTPPGREEIRKIAGVVKELYPAPLVYGGGLKAENAAMLASIPEIDGGLIALTRFSGEIGFYPEEYLEIAKRYLEGARP